MPLRRNDKTDQRQRTDQAFRDVHGHGPRHLLVRSGESCCGTQASGKVPPFKIIATLTPTPAGRRQAETSPHHRKGQTLSVHAQKFPFPTATHRPAEPDFSRVYGLAADAGTRVDKRRSHYSLQPDSPRTTNTSCKMLASPVPRLNHNRHPSFFNDRAVEPVRQVDVGIISMMVEKGVTIIGHEPFMTKTEYCTAIHFPSPIAFTRPPDDLSRRPRRCTDPTKTHSSN